MIKFWLRLRDLLQKQRFYGGHFLALPLTVYLSVLCFYPRTKPVVLQSQIIASLSAEPAVKQTAEPLKQELAKENLVLTIGKGDTLNRLLIGAGVSKTVAQQVIKVLQPHHDLRCLKIGHEIHLQLLQQEGVKLQSLELSTGLGEKLRVVLDDKGHYRAITQKISLRRVMRLAKGKVETSFYKTLAAQGVPASVVRDSLKALSYGVNKSKLSHGSFVIAYETLESKGGAVKSATLQYVGFVPRASSDQPFQAYRYKTLAGKVSYYSPNGESYVTSRLQMPLPSVRVTSRFGPRRSSLRGYSIMHKGVDLGAPIGTLICSAAAGRVVKACYYGNYGNYIMIDHGSGYQTVYAHMQSFKVKPGTYVHAGQAIGRLGMTGRSSGPHLHFECIQNGKHVDPMRVAYRLPSAPLAGKDLAVFRNLKVQVNNHINSNKKAPSDGYYVLRADAASPMG